MALGWLTRRGSNASSTEGDENDEVVDMLYDHQNIIVCSYTAPHVFKEFMEEELADDVRASIMQMMRGIANVIPPKLRERFGETFLGAIAPEEKGSLDDYRTPRRGGVLHGDTQLLKCFLKDVPEFADYMKLIKVNPFIIKALNAATARWLELHPDDSCDPVTPASASTLSSTGSDYSLPAKRRASVPELRLERIMVQDGRVSIRGNGESPMKWNYEKNYKSEDTQHVLRVYDSFRASLEEVLTMTSGGLLHRFASDEMERNAETVARDGLLAVAGIDPSCSPAKLLKNLWSTCLKLGKRFDDLATSSTPWPGTKAKRLKDALDKCVRMILVHRRHISI
eukprot:TRINITY_DN48866_c0_g1_i1.p1 TRINITY_DN48866_c0_g1~~TRINITY_DN48866_c0_g1_i1.p1  ORF type:complete len:350 (+),score=130.53 TRINITY_DN48866_c0_g1_i1:34-1050(+)